ncbi:MAG: RIP metalloprotease RseP [Parcubacteria group bacterium]|jgi:regulator of sigma E protease
MLTVIVFIIILGVLIFVHELGHFVTARRNGIRASEFGFGFPPRIVGFQFLTGKKHREKIEVESVRVEKMDIKLSDNEEIIQETITEKMRKVDEVIPVRKWRIIWGNRDGDSEREMKDLSEARENKYEGGTVYSINWIPLGGFVKIKGEGGENKDDDDSFAGRPAWTRIRVLAAGVIMNFVLAWLLIAVVFMIGAPVAVDSTTAGNPASKVQISEVIPDSPASAMGLQVGDEILKNDSLGTLEEVQNYINFHKGQEITLQVKRGNQILNLKGIPRVDAPAGQGALGIGLAETVVVRYSFFQAIWKGLTTMLNLILAMLLALYGILKHLIMGQGVGADVAGPVGIAVLTKQVTTLGLIYVLQFAALLSINLGIINILPIPALDGGRILFILIEKIKGSPISQKTEQLFHTVGFILLIMLMILVTFRDVMKFFK